MGLVCERPPWHERAACRGVGPEAFFAPVRTAGARPAADYYAQARTICARCPVAEQCRAAGAQEHHGLWAGESPVERRRSHAQAS